MTTRVTICALPWWSQAVTHARVFGSRPLFRLYYCTFFKVWKASIFSLYGRTLNHRYVSACFLPPVCIYSGIFISLYVFLSIFYFRKDASSDGFHCTRTLKEYTYTYFILRVKCIKQFLFLIIFSCIACLGPLVPHYFGSSQLYLFSYN